MATQVSRTRFRVLGALEVDSEGLRVALGGARQERILSTLLLEANRMVPVSRLIDATWEEDPPDTAGHQVRKAVADLRKRLPDGPEVVLTDGAGYRAVVDAQTLDLELFHTLLAQGRELGQQGERAGTVRVLQQALDLWRGPVLSGLDSSVLAAASVALHEQRLSAAEHLVGLRLELGEGRELISVLRDLAREHPLRESFRAQLMQALYQSGRQAEALEEYERIRTLLSEELGADPDPTLVRLHEGILRNTLDLPPPAARSVTPAAPDPAALAPASVSTTAPVPFTDPAPAPPNPLRAVDADPAAGAGPCTLPYDLPDFTGREHELAEIDAVAAMPAEYGPRVVVIDAMGGAGKTALGNRAAHRLISEFPDGQLYIDLNGFSAGLDPLTAETALGSLLGDLGLAPDRIPPGLEARTRVWRAQTAGRRLLLLLDNAADVGQVRPLLPSTGAGMVMITSRNHLLDVDGAVTVFLGAMPEEDCRRLVARIVGGARATADSSATAEMIRLCGRLPLALRIAAARLRSRPQWQMRHIVERLSDEVGRLEELSLADRGVAASLASSYRVLTESDQEAFRLLSLHPGEDLDAFCAAALLGVRRTRAKRLLEDLLDTNLLEQHEHDRYAFHDLIRAFARNAAEELPVAVREAAVDRAADYYVACAQAAGAVLFPTRRQHDLPPAGSVDRDRMPVLNTVVRAEQWMARESRNLVDLIRALAATGRPRPARQAAHLARETTTYLHSHANSTAMVEIGELAVACARRLEDPELLRVCLNNVTIGYWYFGRFEDALTSLQEAIELAVRSADGYGEAVGLGQLAIFKNLLGDYQESLGLLDRALALLQGTGVARQKLNLLIALCDALVALGRCEEAADRALEAVRIGETSGEANRTGIAWINYAEARIGSGDHGEAFSALDRAEAIFRGHRHPANILLVQMRRAEAHLIAGQTALARSVMEQAAGGGEGEEDFVPDLRLAPLRNLRGRILAAGGEHQAAFDSHRSAYELAQSIGFRYEAAHALLGLARSAGALGRGDEARDYCRRAEELFADMGISVQQTLG